jgi:uncharacterized membrane protein YqaE (UPF0057 family)
MHFIAACTVDVGGYSGIKLILTLSVKGFSDQFTVQKAGQSVNAVFHACILQPFGVLIEAGLIAPKKININLILMLTAFVFFDIYLIQNPVIV